MADLAASWSAAVWSQIVSTASLHYWTDADTMIASQDRQLRHEDRSLDLGEAAPVGSYTRLPQNFDPIIADKVIFSIAVAYGTL
jgi:hypothetical protein